MYNMRCKPRRKYRLTEAEFPRTNGDWTAPAVVDVMSHACDVTFGLQVQENESCLLS